MTFGYVLLYNNCLYYRHNVLLILVSFVQDDGGWLLVESSLANNKQLEYLELGGFDAFVLNMGKALTKNTSVRTLWLDRESL